MGILANILGADNPVAKWTLQNQNLLSNWGAGLGAGRTFGEGLGMAAQMGPTGIAADQQVARDEAEKAERQAAINQSAKDLAKFPDLMQAVASKAITPAAAYSEMWKRMSPDYAGTAEGGTEYGLTPQWYQMEDGAYGFGVIGKDGSFKALEAPEGATMLDPRSLATEKAFGTKFGGSQGEATAAAPGDIASATTALDIINQIRTHPELGWATGTAAGLGANAIPGTGRFDFQNLVDQAKSGAFLTAVQEMRGLGALSNAEGGAATQAITRMNTATSTAAFLKALEDYEKIVVNGMERAKGRLATSGPATPADGGATLTYNPATGELE
jgi:hypothetical protein